MVHFSILEDIILIKGIPALKMVFLHAIENKKLFIKFFGIF